MKPIKNNFHYIVTGQFETREGITITNPLVKIKTKTDNTTLENPIVFNEYDVYPSLDVYNNSTAKGGVFEATKIVKSTTTTIIDEEGIETDIVEVNRAIEKNFESNLTDLEIDLQLSQSPQQQLIMLADFLDVNTSDITVVFE